MIGWESVGLFGFWVGCIALAWYVVDRTIREAESDHARREAERDRIGRGQREEEK